MTVEVQEPIQNHTEPSATALVGGIIGDAEKLVQHLVENVEVCLGHSELMTEFRDHLRREFLPSTIAFSQACLDREENLTSIEKIVRQCFEAMSELFGRCQILQYANGDAVD